MSNIKIFMKDGTVEEFIHEGRAGGSWTKTIRYEGDFVIVKDEWGNETAFPNIEISRVETSPHRGGF